LQDTRNERRESFLENMNILSAALLTTNQQNKKAQIASRQASTVSLAHFSDAHFPVPRFTAEVFAALIQQLQNLHQLPLHLFRCEGENDMEVCIP
jgi:hypothetical protein